MWIWSVISLIILIACVIFAYRMIVSSYEFLPSDKRYFLRFKKYPPAHNTLSDQPDVIKILRNKVQHVEENSTFYNMQFNKFQDRLKVIEEKVAASSGAMVANRHEAALREDEEDWKELYYEENEKKESLENELDFARQTLEETEAKLKDLEENFQNKAKLRSDHESRLSEIQSLQENSISLQKQLDGSKAREKELEHLLLSEITIREKYALLQTQYAEMLSETDDLRRRLSETENLTEEFQKARKEQRQLESRLSICREENLKLKEECARLRK